CALTARSPDHRHTTQHNQGARLSLAPLRGACFYFVFPRGCRPALRASSTPVLPGNPSGCMFSPDLSATFSAHNLPPSIFLPSIFLPTIFLSLPLFRLRPTGNPGFAFPLLRRF